MDWGYSHKYLLLTIYYFVLDILGIFAERRSRALPFHAFFGVGFLPIFLFLYHKPHSPNPKFYSYDLCFMAYFVTLIKEISSYLYPFEVFYKIDPKLV